MAGKTFSGEFPATESKAPIWVSRIRKMPKILAKNVWKVGKEDPRRVVHSLKVGLTLTLVSFLYLMEPLFEGIGANSIWAVMTVVVVLEFTAGATLCKGLNRGLGTLIAGSLAFFIEFIAEKSGTVGRAVFIGIAVFLIGAAATYIRFVPYIKKNYDYGVVIFLLTFNLITVSSFRVHNILQMAHQRFYTIAIGCGLCLLMSLLVFPIWSGQDLHDSTVSKLEGLAKSLEACVNKYFEDPDQEIISTESSEDPIYNGYRAILESKSSDESLALFASWEPRHSRRCHPYPGQQYVKLGAVLRHLGYTTVALHGCVQSEIQTPRSVCILFKEPCKRLAGEVSKVLNALGDSIRNKRMCSSQLLSDKLHDALQDLNTALKSQPRLFVGSNHGSGHGHSDRKSPRFSSFVDQLTPKHANASSPVNRIPIKDMGISSPAVKVPLKDAGNSPHANQISAKDAGNSPHANQMSAKDTGNSPHASKISSRDEENSPHAGQIPTRESGVSLPSVKTDTSALLEWKGKRLTSWNRDREKSASPRVLRPTLSKIMLTTLEFSEALPLAAFVSLLVETVARLECVVEEAEELGRLAGFQEIDEAPVSEVLIECEKPKEKNDKKLLSHTVSVAID